MASEQATQSMEAFSLGEFQIDRKRRTIKGPSGEITVEPKVMAVLMMLTERPGEVITRQEFIESIWAREYGGDESLTRAVSRLRKVFRDTRSPIPQIETVPKTGYRLVQDDQPIEVASEESKRYRGLALGAAAALAIIILLLVLFFRVEGLSPGSIEGHPNQVVIAVPTFESHSKLPDDQLLALGLTDEVLSALSRSQSISVVTLISPTGSLGAKGIDVASIAKYTGASHIVKGSMSRSHGEIRVSVHLLDVDTGQVEWSDVVVRSENELFTIPTQVAIAIERALGTEPEQSRFTSVSQDPVAYEAYLMIRAMQRMSFVANLYVVIAELEAIVEKDPGLAEAWGTLAQARLDFHDAMTPTKPENSGVDSPGSHEKARREANVALSLDPGSVDALLALAIIDFREKAIGLTQWEDRLQSLLAEAPNHPVVNLRLGMFMIHTGRFEAAVKLLGRAVQLEPLASFPGAFFTDALLNSGRRDEARKFLEMRQMRKLFPMTYTGMTLSLLDGDFEAARKLLQAVDGSTIFGAHHLIKLQNLPVDSAVTERWSRLFDRLISAAEQGNPAVDSSIAEEFIAAADEGPIVYFHVAQLLAAAGYLDEALALVHDRLDKGDIYFYESGILLRPAFEKARQNPQIMELFSKSGRLEYWWKTGNWPDYCTAEHRPYDCEQAALQFLETEL